MKTKVVFIGKKQKYNFFLKKKMPTEKLQEFLQKQMADEFFRYL